MGLSDYLIEFHYINNNKVNNKIQKENFGNAHVFIFVGN